ncbi:MAG: hypothetical protein WBP29_04865 [Candidatus Zixiibacteriota bacterium]
MTGRKIARLLAGAAGVALVSRVGATTMDAMFAWSVAACLLAPMCCGLAGVYIKLLKDVGPTKALSVTFLMPAFGVLWA